MTLNDNIFRIKCQEHYNESRRAFERILGKNDMNSLFDAFDWAKTPQGHWYWYIVGSGFKIIDERGLQTLALLYEYLIYHPIYSRDYEE